MINCVIIDDEQHAIELLSIHVKQTPFLNLVNTFLNPLEALSFLNSEQNERIDLLFLDINMPELSGLDFIKLLNENYQIILTTAYKEFALEGYEYNVVDFLLKPVMFNRFLKSVIKVQDELAKVRKSLPADIEGESHNFFFIKTEHKGKHLKIGFDEIDYIESMKNYVAIYRGKSKKLALMTMKSLEDILPRNKFIRVHYSFIVAIDKITMIEGNMVSIAGIDKPIPIGITYKDRFFEMLKITGSSVKLIE